MRPAFSSTTQAAAFALLLLVLLILPAVMGKNLLPPREQAYAVQGWGHGPYPWIRNQIFEETNDIDIAFVGSSHIFNAVNTPQVQAELSRKLGRPAVVRTIAWGGAGYEGLYLITRDLLAHRRVKLLVFYDENPEPGARPGNPAATTWFRFGDNADALRGLPLPDQELYYFAAIVGMPRNLLCLVRPNLPAPLVTDQPNYWTLIAHAPNPATRLGCLISQLGFAPNLLAVAAPFEFFAPATTARPADVINYSPATKTNFEFSSAPIPAWQIHFARRFAALLRARDVRPVMLYLPVLAEARAPVILERAFWPDVLTGAGLLGIPPAKLFGGLTDAELRKIYADPVHFNQNGQEYFTRLITPKLIELYETQSGH
ncbi:MAG TPA: hypothetical protein VF492_11435 [Verrucomicrobiae bacterium]